MDGKNNVSQRLLRKGALVPETYKLFAKWDNAATFEENLRRGLDGQFHTTAWENEVRTTIRRRFSGCQEALSLIEMAKRGLPYDEWCSCLHLWIGIHEDLYSRFVTEWLYPEFHQGRYMVRVKDVIPFVQKYWPQLNAKAKILSEYGLIRTARDLVRMATDFGLLNGVGPNRKYASYHLTDRCFIYWAQRIAEYEGGNAKVLTSMLWCLALMNSLEVEQNLLRLHQFRKLEYQVAGSLIQLDLPALSASDYVEVMMNG